MVYKRTKSWTSGPNFPVLTFAEYSPGLVVVKEERNSNNLMVVVVIGGNNTNVAVAVVEKGTQ